MELEHAPWENVHGFYTVEEVADEEYDAWLWDRWAAHAILILALCGILAFWLAYRVRQAEVFTFPPNSGEAGQCLHQDSVSGQLSWVPCEAVPEVTPKPQGPPCKTLNVPCS